MYRPQVGQTATTSQLIRWFIRAVRDTDDGRGFIVQLIPSYRNGVWLEDEPLELSSEQWCRWCEANSIFLEVPDWSLVRLNRGSLATGRWSDFVRSLWSTA
jgi:hypothetical protein